MTKDQVSPIAEGLKVRLDDDSNGALESITSILSGDLSVQSEARQGILQVVCSDNLMDLFKQQSDQNVTSSVSMFDLLDPARF